MPIHSDDAPAILIRRTFDTWSRANDWAKRETAPHEGAVLVDTEGCVLIQGPLYTALRMYTESERIRLYRLHGELGEDVDPRPRILLEQLQSALIGGPPHEQPGPGAG
jgi:hypothetical protein